MIDNAYYLSEVQGPYELFDLGNFTLKEGPTLRGCQLAYATFGELNDARNNAILVTTWYSGTHQIFADAYIGPERALDPEKYFIVIANQIGDGRISSCWTVSDSLVLCSSSACRRSRRTAYEEVLTSCALSKVAQLYVMPQDVVMTPGPQELPT